MPLSAAGRAELDAARAAEREQLARDLGLGALRDADRAIVGLPSADVACALLERMTSSEVLLAATSR